jgi:hypothetical protein
MSETAFPDTPKGSRFGWPKPARLEEFHARLKVEDLPTVQVVFQGGNQDIARIRVPIELAKYRLSNGRTASLQVEHLARHPDLRRDLFTGDPEMWDAQEAQHELLLQLSSQSELDKYFEDSANKQVGALLLDQDGFVVNGNRRLSTWRQLLADEPSKYQHFEYIDVAILPHATDKDIDRLEALLQIERDIRADYPWDAQANMMIAKMERDGTTPAELCHLYKMKEPELRELFDMRAYADEYLRSRGKADMWSEVSSGQEHTFRRLVQNRAKLAGVARQEMFKEAAFALIDDPSSVGRLYLAIPELAVSLDKVGDRLWEEFAVEASVPDDGLDALFGDGQPSAPAAREATLATVLQDPQRLPRAREVIADVLESERQLKKDVKKAGYLLDVCAKANAALTAAVKDGLRPESKLGGVASQLDAIEKRITQIRAFLAQHAKA